MTKYTEILKLKEMLDKAHIKYQYFTDNFFGWQSQLPRQAYLKAFYPAYQLRLNKNIDAVEHIGSYGNAEDLLEIMGALTEEEFAHGEVLGCLTAEEVFKRFKYCYYHETTIYVDEENI